MVKVVYCDYANKRNLPQNAADKERFAAIINAGIFDVYRFFQFYAAIRNPRYAAVNRQISES